MKTTVELSNNTLTVSSESYNWSYTFNLEGSEKQINYALDLIKKDINQFAEKLNSSNLDLAKAYVHLEGLKKENSAKWFIDNCGFWQDTLKLLRDK